MPDLNTASQPQAAPDSINELLSGLEIENLELDSGFTEEEAIAQLDSLDLTAIEAHAAIEEAYDEQAPAPIVEATETVKEADATTPAPAERKSSAKKTASATPTPKNLADLDPAVFVLTDGVTDLEANKKDVILKTPTQKKIAEKFEGLFRARAANKQPSTYIVSCFKLLSESSSGSMTSTELVASLRTVGYNEGTARSQTGQIMALFDLVGIAKRSGQTLTLDRSSPMTKWLSSVVYAS